MIAPLEDLQPSVPASAFVAANATVAGNVLLGRHASVWFNAVLRGDVEAIVVGDESNIQDGAILHTDPGFPVRIGQGVTIGHAARLHGCTVMDGALIGIGATVLDGAVIGRDSLIGANSLVTPGKQIPERVLVMGAPARVIRELTDAEVKELRRAAAEYVKLGATYARAGNFG
ncbi:gamma carbonic anhydrase family protein [Cupriavidus sp. UYPR2.512]|uniref:gamma carbonic anhydrase family protein n=1 Tax=Cupriavidus sp. UYPR2.512 TaxID=1080187 RepID=UPI00036B5431|nr:gamma carbonic anhydrase family protein [Cupriavidus sp. UYPR2.512]UIF84733.1 gamma carbonic anhydrase family protein [Cupriavidus necator]